MRSCDSHRSFPGIEIANTHPPRFEFWTSLLGPRTMIRFLPRSFYFCPILSLASRFTAGGPFTVSALRSATDDRHDAARHGCEAWCLAKPRAVPSPQPPPSNRKRRSENTLPSRKRGVSACLLRRPFSQPRNANFLAASVVVL